MYVLGINAAFHDSSAALLRDGIPVAAAEEERFTRIKHGKRPMPLLSHQLPFHAINYCLAEADLTLADVDHIAYSYNPELADGWGATKDTSGFGRYQANFLEGIRSAPRLLREDVPHHLKRRFDVADGKQVPPIQFVEHHLAHAASAYYASPFEEAAVLTLDGRGEVTTSLLGMGRGPQLEKCSEVPFPSSLGLLYEQVTAHLGFLNSSDEYKVMAMASSGDERFVPSFREAITVRDGTYRVAPLDLTWLAGRARKSWEPLEPHHFALARAAQVVVEETALELARWLQLETKAKALCMAGGVALNCVMNARMRDEGPFEQIFVQPAAGDAGTSLGAAFLAYVAATGKRPEYVMRDAYLGPDYSETQIQRALDRSKLSYTRPPSIARATAEILARNEIAAWFQGRMEFGPRALGARSIVAATTDPAMKDRLNSIKDREEFRPVAPAVLEERASEFFQETAPDPFMLFIRDVRPERAAEIPSARHVDGTARVQTVSKRDAPQFHELIEEFGALTGTPVIVNTSFNSLGRPIVCTPEDAIECYCTTPLDALAIGPFLLQKQGVQSR
jgi:carbamoyltransferase